MLCVVLISSLVLLTSLIRAVTQYNTIPEKVKIFQREEEKTAKEFLVNMPGGSSGNTTAPDRSTFVTENVVAV
jgi:hypothetical protein